MERRWLEALRSVPAAYLDLTLMVLAALDVALSATPSLGPNYLLSAVACLSLAFRRRLPRATLLVTLPGLLFGEALLAAMIALYSVARSRQLDAQTLGSGVLVCGCFLFGPLHNAAALGLSELSLRLIYGGLAAGAPITIGLLVRTYLELCDRLTELAMGREQQQQLHDHAVRSEERARLARDMHDVVSHQVTLIAIQAGALQMVAAEPDAQRIAGTIRRLSNRTLEELRQLVGVLRSAGSCEFADQPKLGDIPQLLADSGAPVTLHSGPLPEQVPPAVSCAAYRTVQEALTNVGKHAVGAPVTVQVGVVGDALQVQVRNAAPRGRSGMTPLPYGGHGLMGLRERATMLGGTFDAHPTIDGGFLIKASFPVACAPELNHPRPRDPDPTETELHLSTK